MKVRLANITQNAVEEIYKGYRICYAKGEQDDIKIPIFNGLFEDVPDIGKMSNFIRPLMANGHTSPLEHCSVTFYINGVSRALMSQLTRHRTAKFNIQSQRYVDGNNFDFITPKSVMDKGLDSYYAWFMQHTMDVYNTMIDAGVPKEDARMVLPNATTCNITVTMDLNNFRKFYGLRACKNAQWEIKALAQEMMRQVKEQIPFADYQAMACGRTCNECFEK